MHEECYTARIKLREAECSGKNSLRPKITGGRMNHIWLIGIPLVIYAVIAVDLCQPER